MKRHVLFIQGGGDNGYDADAAMVDSLRQALGDAYEVTYPRLHADENTLDFGWPRQIGEKLDDINGDVILVAHSVGASLLLKYLSEVKAPKKIRAVFLLATPYWAGDEDWKKGLKLDEDFAGKLPGQVPIFLYHCLDDTDVSVDDLSTYARKMPHAAIHRLVQGGHQFNNDLRFLAKDIQKI
ncbi:MAG: alpha/beta hydrolase [Bacteroidetes bacterium]|nr:alpha/beta hydrolase [Bacteroidota bacterium]